MLSSAAAGGSLIGASLVLVVVVSAMIGVRGFRSTAEVPAAQSVVLKSAERDREAGAAATPQPVVIGGRSASGKPDRKARRSSRSTARSGRRASDRATARTRRAPARSGLASPALPAAEAPARRDPATPPAEPSPDAPDRSPGPAVTLTDPVNDVAGAVEDAKPVESVGDVLLDLRDALP